MRISKSYLIIFTLFIVFFALVACGGNQLVGDWEGFIDDMPVTFSFFANGRGVLNNSYGSFGFDWNVEGNRLMLSYDRGDSYSGTFNVSGRTLTFVDRGMTETFTRIQ